MELSPRRALVLCQLLSGHTSEEIASSLRMSVGNVERIRRGQDFKQALRDAVREIYGRAIGELATGAITAATRIKKIVENEKTSDSHAIASARLVFDVLESARRWELEERLERIEQLLKHQNQDGDVNQPHNSQN